MRRLTVVGFTAMSLSGCGAEEQPLSPDEIRFNNGSKSTSGTLAVSASTSGSHRPNNFQVTVNGVQVKSVKVNGSTSFNNLAPGVTPVVLTVPANCTVTEPNPRTVTVTAGGTAETAFQVVCGAPVVAPASVTLLAAGDLSICNHQANSHFDDLTAELVERWPNAVVATLGDHTTGGRDDQFRDCYAPTWGRFRERTRPAIGNHDYVRTISGSDTTFSAAAYFDYFGSLAGNPARGYYSYRHGEWHVVVLNVNHPTQTPVSAAEDSEQVQWLRADLAANARRCILAYWHAPRYSSGPQSDLSAARHVWSVLFEAGADVVLSGHDHSYERFAKQDHLGAAHPAGIRQFVVGTGGHALRAFATVKPNSQVRDATTHGILRLTLHADAYEWEFLPVGGGAATDSGRETCN